MSSYERTLREKQQEQIRALRVENEMLRLELGAYKEESKQACLSAAEVETLRRERDEARAWQLSVAELTGYINRAEGQAGYEIADAGTIAHALNSTKGDARAYSETLAYLSKVGAQGHDVDGDAQQGIASLAEQRDEAERALAASQAHAAQLREALVGVVNMAEFAALCDGDCQPGIDKHTATCREATARAALALPPGDALRAFATRLCEAQRTATARYLARADVTWDALWEMELEAEKAPLVVDDVLGKGAKR